MQRTATYYVQGIDVVDGSRILSGYDPTEGAHSGSPAIL